MYQRCFKCTRHDHTVHGGVVLCMVGRQPASACAINISPEGCNPNKLVKSSQAFAQKQEHETIKQ